MDLLPALRRLQGVAESRMTDRCRITRTAESSGDLDPVTGMPTAGARTVIYEGVCRFRTGGAISAGSQREVAGDGVTQVASVLHLPISAPQVKVDDRVEVLSSVNPTLVRLFTVSGLVPGSQMTAQRVQVTAVIG